MRLSKLISWVLTCGALVFLVSTADAQSSARVAGRIVVAKAEGDVTATDLSTAAQRKLSTNDVIGEKYRVATGTSSQAILVFSNGATINLGANSDLAIEEFLQDPFAENVPLSDLTEEPGTSTTRLNLARGELVGNVKRLKADQGSRFVVNTPVGAAGIRGTTFRIVFRPDANGRVTFTLSTSDGVVLFDAPASAGVSVETGKEVAVEVEVAVNAATGTVTVVGTPVVSTTQDIPAATQAVIASAAQQVVEAAQNVILSTNPAAPAPTPPESTPPAADETDTTQQDSPPAATTEPPFTPAENSGPVITTPPPDVTPGAGAN